MTTSGEKGYLNLLNDILANGSDRGDRTGTGTRGVFGRQIRFNLSEGFPLLTTKKVFLRGIIEELLWFLRGSTNAKELEDKNVNIWKAWGDPETRELGPVYGKQWRNWENIRTIPKHPDSDWDGYVAGGYSKEDTIGVTDFHMSGTFDVRSIDQITQLIHRIKTDPESRRHLVVAWNPGEVELMALPPCHCLFQFYVEPLNRDDVTKSYFAYRNSLSPEERRVKVDQVTMAEGRHKTLDDLALLGLPTSKLSCQLYQRSADVFLGVPFNIASYALLTMMVAQQCDLELGEFVHTFGDVHIYNDHMDQVKLQLTREPYAFPTMHITKAEDIFSYTIDSFQLEGYECHPIIKADVSA